MVTYLKLTLAKFKSKSHPLFKKDMVTYLKPIKPNKKYFYLIT